MHLEDAALSFWNDYIDTLSEELDHPIIEAGMPGDITNSGEIIKLILSGSKTATSGLVKDYELAGDSLPKEGNFWIVLNELNKPQCILRTVRVVINKFSEITEEIANAEAYGDSSVKVWKKTHLDFFTPYLEGMDIDNLDEENIVTEFFEIVHK